MAPSETLAYDWAEDSKEPLFGATGLETSYERFLIDKLKQEPAFLEVLTLFGVSNLKSFIAFIQKSAKQMLELMGSTAFRTHREAILRCLVLQEQRKPGQFLYQVPTNDLPAEFDPNVFTMSYRKHKRNLRTEIGNAETQAKIHDMKVKAGQRHLVEQEAFWARTPTVAPNSHPNSVNSPPHNDDAGVFLEDNEPPAYDDNIGKTGIPLPQQAAFFAAEQAMHRLQNPRGYRPNAPPTVIARTVARATFNSKIKWNGQRETFATFQSLFEGQLHQTQCGYAIDPDFAVAFGKDQDRCLIDYPEYDITPAQLKADNHYISGAIMSSCSGTAITHCMLDRHKKNRDGILAWADCIKVYVLTGTKKLQIAAHEETIQVKYTPGYKNGIVGFVATFGLPSIATSWTPVPMGGTRF